MATMALITLTTDFGDSHYVGAMKGALLAIHPGAQVVDITHGVRPHDVRAGAFALAAAAPFFPDGTIHVAVVDPGVGGARRPLLVECRRGFLVGPDNGLLMPAANRLGLVRARELTNRSLWRAEVSPTFHGRDIFAPVAAHLASGATPPDVGPVIPDPQPLDFGAGRVEEGALVGDVVLVDTFGTGITNIPAALARTVLQQNQAFVVEWAGGAWPARFCTTYAEVARGEVVLVIGSAGYLEIAVRDGSFVDLARLAPGATVRLRPGSLDAATAAVP